MSDNLELALIIWLSCNVVWMVINMFFTESRMEPNTEIGKVFFCVAFVLSPVFAFTLLIVVFLEHLYQPLFKERTIRKKIKINYF